VDRRDDDRRELGLQRPAALGHDAEPAAQQALRRRRAQHDQRLGPDDVDLRAQPRPARADLAGVGLLVDAPLAALLEAEVLDGVRDVDLVAVDPRELEGAAELASRGADERAPLAVLAVAGHLADEHHPGVLVALAEDGLRRGLPEVAPAAAAGGLA